MAELHLCASSFLDADQKPTEKLEYLTSAICGRNSQHNLHSHSFAEVFFVTSGEGYFCTEENEVPIKENTLLMINPNIRHTEKSCESCDLSYIIMGIDNLYFSFPGFKDHSFHAFNLGNKAQDVIPILNLTLEEVMIHQQTSFSICHHYLSVFFLKIQNLLKDQFSLWTIRNYPCECELIKDYMSRHYSKNITLDSLSELSGLNKYYLTRIFSKSYGISPINYLLERRILQAEELLKTTDMTISQISDSVGFSTANYFSQSFKRCTGMTPISYRETHYI